MDTTIRVLVVNVNTSLHPFIASIATNWEIFLVL